MKDKTEHKRKRRGELNLWCIFALDASDTPRRSEGDHARHNYTQNIFAKIIIPPLFGRVTSHLSFFTRYHTGGWRGLGGYILAHTHSLFLFLSLFFYSFFAFKPFFHFFAARFSFILNYTNHQIQETLFVLAQSPTSNDTLKKKKVRKVRVTHP